jgi:hypothetical protein
MGGEVLIFEDVRRPRGTSWARPVATQDLSLRVSYIANLSTASMFITS